MELALKGTHLVAEDNSLDALSSSQRPHETTIATDAAEPEAHEREDHQSVLTGVCVPPSGGRAFEVTVRGVEGEVRTLIDVLAPFSFGSDPTVRSLVVGVLDELQEDSLEGAVAGSALVRGVSNPHSGSVTPSLYG